MPGAARDSKSAERGAAVREAARVTWFDGLDGLDGGGYRFNSHSMGKYGNMMINYGIWCRSAIFRDTQVKLFYDRIPCWVMGHKWSKITSFLREGRTKNQAPIYGQWGTRTLETKLSCSHQNSSYCWTFILPNVGTSIGRSRHTLTNFDPFLCMTSQVDILEWY